MGGSGADGQLGGGAQGHVANLDDLDDLEELADGDQSMPPGSRQQYQYNQDGT